MPKTTKQTKLLSCKLATCSHCICYTLASVGCGCTVFAFASWLLRLRTYVVCDVTHLLIYQPCIHYCCTLQVVNVLGFSLPFYKSPTLLLSLGLSIRVFWYLLTRRPDVIHVSSPGLLVFSAIMYAKLLAIPLVVSYHTHIPEYIPKYAWRGLVEPMWNIIRYCTLVADLTLVPSRAMKASLLSLEGANFKHLHK